MQPAEGWRQSQIYMRHRRVWDSRAFSQSEEEGGMISDRSLFWQLTGSYDSVAAVCVGWLLWLKGWVAAKTASSVMHPYMHQSVYLRGWELRDLDPDPDCLIQWRSDRGFLLLARISSQPEVVNMCLEWRRPHRVLTPNRFTRSDWSYKILPVLWHFYASGSVDFVRLSAEPPLLHSCTF